MLRGGAGPTGARPGGELTTGAHLSRSDVGFAGSDNNAVSSTPTYESVHNEGGPPPFAHPDGRCFPGLMSSPTNWARSARARRCRAQSQNGAGFTATSRWPRNRSDRQLSCRHYEGSCRNAVAIEASQERARARAIIFGAAFLIHCADTRVDTATRPLATASWR
jgi:hypothetical protein